MKFLARIVDGQSQLLKDHIDGVSDRISRYALPGFGATTQLLAIVHDIGKYSLRWQHYLEGKISETVPHSPFGAHMIDTLFSQMSITEQNILARDVLQFVIQAHHGIFDALSLGGNHAIDSKKTHFEKVHSQYYGEIKRVFLEEYSPRLIAELANESLIEFSEFMSKIVSLKDGMVDPHYAIGALARILLSALIDADWSDASAFHGDDSTTLDSLLEHFSWDEPLNSLQTQMNSFQHRTHINDLRDQIAKECRESAGLATGIYQLHVPTGGGKTLAVMQFALKHASLNQKSRIIYAAPYKSIIVQTADVYKNFLTLNVDQRVRNAMILEHHGDVIQGASNENDESYSMYEYLTGSWKSPIILTTLVQLLNTMFSDSKKSIRRLHNLTNAILIIDEFQSVPNHSKSLFNSFINVLSLWFGTTVILCSATQPDFRASITDSKTYRQLTSVAYSKPINLVRDYSNEVPFIRTHIADHVTQPAHTIESVARLIRQGLENKRSLLVVLNTRAAVNHLYQYLSQQENDFDIILLSNNMCPAHLKAQIGAIRNHLAQIGNSDGTAAKLLVISTSLIEAGVDLSFEEAIRSLAGLDSIIQTAGRCNRNGEHEIGTVRIVNAASDWENVSPMKDLVVAQEIMYPILNDFKVNPKKYDNSLMSNQAVSIYYNHYFKRIAGETHYRVTIGEVETSLFELLSSNQHGVSKYQYLNNNNLQHILNQAFLTAGRNFEAIEEYGTRIIVPWDKRGEELIVQLGRENAAYEIARLLKEVERYSISVTPWQHRELKQVGAIFQILDNEVEVLRGEYYSNEQGLIVVPEAQKTITF